MLSLIKEDCIGIFSFSRSIVSMDNDCNLIRCIYLNNKSCKTRPTLINLNLDICNQVLCYYSFLVNLDELTGSFSTLDDPKQECKFKHCNFDNINKWIKNINKTYVMWM